MGEVPFQPEEKVPDWRGPTPADISHWATEKPREPAGEPPDCGSTFRISLEDLGVSDDRAPHRVAADISRNKNGGFRVRVRTPTTFYVLDEGKEDIRQEPVPGENWKQGQILDEEPAWIRAVLAFLSVEERF